VLWVVVGIFWVVFLVGFYAVCKPRFEAIERRREVVGDREIPRPAKYLIAALVCVAAIAPIAITIVIGLDAAGVLVGSVVLAASMSAIMAVGLRSARIAQRRPPAAS
jgi:predicted lysophospholipase L1 biosynthesis ABC-type transport system permease subunit